MELTEKILDTKDIFEGHVFKVKVHSIELPDGSPATREVVLHNGGVGVIAVDENGMVPMVRQFRTAANIVTLEIPAGKLEKGENPYDAGMRELTEETGYVTEGLIELGEYFATPAYCSEKLTLNMAKDLEFKGQSLDDGEFLNVEKIHIDDLFEMVMNNEIYDCKTAIAILKAKAMLDK